MGERSLAEEWEARAGDWERWVRVPGHDRHFHRYNWPAFLELIPDPGVRPWTWAAARAARAGCCAISVTG